MGAAGIAPDVSAGDPYADAAARLGGGPAGRAVPDDAEEAAARLYDLALTFQERSQTTEAACSPSSRSPRRAWPASSAT